MTGRCAGHIRALYTCHLLAGCDERCSSVVVGTC
jgi:hypothetical protein